MSITIRRVQKRLRSKSQLRHKPSGRGKGKWHNPSDVLELQNEVATVAEDAR